MNTSESSRGTIETCVGVFINDTDVEGLRLGEPALFAQPEGRLLEKPTNFLRKEFVSSGRRASPNTWAAAAYALASWLEFLNELGITDWAIAAQEDLICYRDSYAIAISPKTGNEYSPITIGNRMSVILHFYDYAGGRGWYDGDILVDPVSDSRHGDTRAESDSLRGKPGERRALVATSLLPRRRRSRMAMRPFLVAELKALLSIVGPRSTERREGDRSSRDRLLVDLGWVCGLRLEEIHQLTTLQFLGLHPEPTAPVAEQALYVTGKGKKRRMIAIPNWLALDVLAYISGHRRKALCAGGISSRRDRHQLFVAEVDSNAPGQPISRRRIQQIFADACVAAGLVEVIEKTDPTTGAKTITEKSKHCVHDLRHTYAVLTYWAEKELGNSEPWKKIQAQLGHSHLSTTVDTYLGYVDIFSDRRNNLSTFGLMRL